jgi:hypothetical protein
MTSHLRLIRQARALNNHGRTWLLPTVTVMRATAVIVGIYTPITGPIIPGSSRKKLIDSTAVATQKTHTALRSICRLSAYCCDWDFKDRFDTL